MYIDDFISVIQTKDERRTSFPIYCNMRTMRYIDIATEFLSVKAAGKLHYWFQAVNNSDDPINYPLDKYKNLKPLKQNTVNAYGHYLGMFLRWCEEKGYDCGDFERYDFHNVETLRSEHCGSLEEYADDLRQGAFLKVQNVMGFMMHVTIADEFLMFLYATKRRSKPYTHYNITKPRRDFGKKAIELKRWHIPAPSELKAWIASLKSTEDQLIAELICFAGFRHDDVLSLKEANVPNLAKAKETGEHDRVYFDVYDGKFSKDRTTSMPTSTLVKLRKYITDVRKKRLKKYDLKSPFVFVSTDSRNFGEPFSRQKVRNIFRQNFFGENGTPSQRWHPHMGRHAFACHRLVELIVNHQRHFSVSVGDALANAMLYESQLSYLQLEMGHVQAATTAKYLEWANRNKIELAAINAEVLNNG